MNISNFKVILIKIMKIINKKNEKSLIDEFVANFKKDILKKNKAERFSFVLTGGKSPIKLYEKLSSENKVYSSSNPQYKSNTLNKC